MCYCFLNNRRLFLLFFLLFFLENLRWQQGFRADKSGLGGGIPMPPVAESRCF